MTDHNRDLTGPTEAKAVDRPKLRTDMDPIAIVTELVSDDPSLAELVAFRDAMPDLKFAAREAKRLADESMRLRNRTESLDAVRSAVAGLTLVSLGFKALVAIWPSDDLDAVDAKLALSEATGPHLGQEADYVPSLSPELATRIRIKRAAFHVGELVVPAGPSAPSASDRGLADWPLARYDLTSLLPPRGGPPVFVEAQLEAWAGLIANVPDLGKLAERVERLLATADRLMALAHVPGDDAAQQRRAAEGALISAYLAAAQVALWPVTKGSDGVAAKKRVAKAINDRACRGDALNMQAAIRMISKTRHGLPVSLAASAWRRASPSGSRSSDGCWQRDHSPREEALPRNQSRAHRRLRRNAERGDLGKHGQAARQRRLFSFKSRKARGEGQHPVGPSDD